MFMACNNVYCQHYVSFISKRFILLLNRLAVGYMNAATAVVMQIEVLSCPIFSLFHGYEPQK